MAKPWNFIRAILRIQCVYVVVPLEHLSGTEIHVVHATRFEWVIAGVCVCVWVSAMCVYLDGA